MRNVTCSGFHGSSGLDDVLRPPRFCNKEPILCLRLLPCPCPSCILREEERDPERPSTFLPPCFVADSHVRARENTWAETQQNSPAHFKGGAGSAAPPQLMASIADRLKRKREKKQEEEEEGEEFVKEKTMRMEPLPSPFMLVKICNY